MQQALGDGADLQQHMQTAASLGAFAQQLRAQQEGGGAVTSDARSSSAAPAAQHPQPNGSAQGTQGGAPRGSALFGAAHQAAPPSGPSTASSSGTGGFLPAPQGRPQGLTHPAPPPPGHHAWRVTSERQQLQQGGGGSASQPLPAADVPPGTGLTARPGRQPVPQSHSMPAAAAPRFPIDYSPLPGVAAAAQGSHVAPRRFFGDPGSSEIQPADDPPGPPMRFMHPPGSYHGGGHGSTLPQRRGETYEQVRCCYTCQRDIPVSTCR